MDISASVSSPLAREIESSGPNAAQIPEAHSQVPCFCPRLIEHQESFEALRDKGIRDKEFKGLFLRGA